MFIGLKFMSIRRKKADYLMVLIKHVINIPLFHTQRTHPVIPDVGNRESSVFPCRPFSFIERPTPGSHNSWVILALPKGCDSLIEPWIELF